MGKVVSKIAKIVSVVAAVGGIILTGGALAAGFLSAGGLGGAFAAVRAIGTIGTLFRVSAFAGALSMAFNKPKIDMGQVVRQRTELNLNPSPDRKWVFGYTAAAMDMIYAEVYGPSEEYYAVVLAHAGHLITSYEQLWIDGEVVPFSGTAATGRWAGLLTREQKLGTDPQTALTINGGARWTSTETATGIAVQALLFTADQERNSRGLPTRIVQEIKGSPVYDPRLDTTVGGSGTHRADDQTTWQFNDGTTDIGRNAALVYLTYMLGWKDSGEIVLGVGISPDDIMYDTFIEAANVAEANNWFFDGILADGDGHGRNLRAVLNSFAGEPLEVGGKFGVRAPFDDTSVVALALTGDRLMGAIYREGSPEYRERANIARGRYVEPLNAYQPEEYAPVVLADLLAVDGSELPIPMDFPGTQDPAVAQQLAGVMMREMRQPTVRFVTDQTGLAVRPGEIVSITLDEAGFSTTKIRVKSHSFSFESLRVEMEGKIVKATDYDLVDPGLAGDMLTPSLSKFDELLNAPNLTGLAAVGVPLSAYYGTVISDVQYGFAVSWDQPVVSVFMTQVQYRLTGEPDWINAPSAIGDTNGYPNSSVIPGIVPDTTYDIRARHISLRGVAGDWQILTDVSSTIRTLESPQNLSLTEVLVLGSDGEYRMTGVLTFDPPTDPTGVISYEAQYRFLPRHGTTWQPLFNSTRTNWEFPVFEIGTYQVRIRSIYVQDIIYSDWAEVQATALGTYTAISAIGLSDPEAPELYITLDDTNRRADVRIITGYDKTGDPIEPEYFVIFYSVDDIPNKLTLGSDAGTKLYIDDVNIESEYVKTVQAGSTTREVIADYSDMDIDLSGMWWFRVESGLNGDTSYYKVTRASTSELAINDGEELPYVPQAGDTVRIIEVSFHDSRIPEFKLAWINGEVVKHNGVKNDGVGYYFDVVTRGAEGTSQANQTGKTLHYYPAYGIDTTILAIPLADFDKVGDLYQYANNVGVQLPPYFAWASITCCFVREATRAEGVKWVRSNIVPLTVKGKA